jgi:hypothetical protein
MSDRTVVAERSKARIHIDAEAANEIAVYKVVIRTVAAFAGLIGIWAFACLGSAMYQAGGPVQLVRGWFNAVTGM